MMVVICLIWARWKNFPYLESHIYTSQEIRLDLQITRNLEIHPHRLYMLFNLIGACEDNFSTVFFFHFVNLKVMGILN